MPFNDFERVLDEIKIHCNPKNILVSTLGGEPLLRNDILDCGNKITQKGFIWGLVSNGILIDDHLMGLLSNAGLKTLSIDIDGLRDDHNWLRCDPTAFDKVYNALNAIHRVKGLTWDVITCVTQRNISKLEELKKLLLEANVKRWRIFTIFPMGRAKDNDVLFLNDSDFVKLMDFIAYTRHEGKINLSYACEGFLGPYEGFVRDYIFRCDSGTTVASIRANGDISGCLSVRSQYSQGNIYRDSFWDVWRNRFQIMRNRSWMKNKDCGECNMFPYCQGNGFHLRDDSGKLTMCHYKKLQNQGIH